MLKKMMLIVNPVSGKGAAKSYLLDILDVFMKNGYVATVYLTTKHGDATEYARMYAPDYKLIACIGGDGTLSEVVSGLMELPQEQRPPVGYLPMGTTNDMANNFELPKKTLEVAETIMQGVPHTIDVGKMNDMYFSYIAAFGAFSEVSYATSQSVKNVLGHFAYVLSGVASIGKVKSVRTRVEYDGHTLEDTFIFGAVANSFSVAGMVKLRPDEVGLDDGEFEILLVRKPDNIADLTGIVTNVLKKNYDSEHVVLLHAKKATFSFDEPVSWTRDGENGGAHTLVTTENLHSAVRIMVDKTGEDA